MSTSFYPPFMAARSLATLDHVSDGRAGGNLVTTSSHRSANNFGLERHYDHDLRYRMAGEWVSVVSALLDSWEKDALVQDAAKGIFADHTKIHTIDFEGEFFKCRGPLNAPPGPQGRPVYCQAGASPAGREFAARNVDTLLCVPLGLEAMKEFRQDMDRRLIANGRKPTDLKIFYLINPTVAETDEIAQDIYDRGTAAKQTNEALEKTLAMMSYFSGTDFSKFNLDEPMPDLTGKVNGHQSSMERFAKDGAKQKTLRELALGQDVVGSIPLVGSPATVAQKMGEAMDYVGGDGFMFACPLDRRVVATITDGLIPELQARGLTRTHYEHEHFKDNLMAF
jgi:FMN-dependent oxidoreductase (nitrilotriacetate monooxygenase family)